MNFAFKWIESPLGPLNLVGQGQGLAAILWKNDNPRRVRLGPLTEDSRNQVPPRTVATRSQSLRLATV